jgi:putative phage-type endonuclease
MEDKVKFLLDNYGQDDQRTQIWHTKRGQMLTASEIWKTTKGSTLAQRRELMISKLTPRVETGGNGSRALLWGTRFEPIAKDIYCIIHDVEITDTSCVPHPVHSFLGASPDGLITSSGPRFGNLVEFKCPISRAFDDTTPVPDAYFHQMQLQMECTQLDLCEYIEFQFKELNYNEWFETVAEYKSAFAYSSSGEVRYRDFLDTRPIQDWREQYLNDGQDWTIVYWTLVKHRSLNVPKDPTWLETHLPHFQETWNQILEHRQNGTLPEDPKKNVVLTL